MNGHPRRDTDLILRPSESTIDFLSVFIGFGSLRRVKIVVFDETIGYIQMFIEKLIFFLNFCFVPGIILDHFSYRKSIFRYPKLNNLDFFDIKIDFLIETSISR